jgi:hypothetical protein
MPRHVDKTGQQQQHRKAEPNEIESKFQVKLFQVTLQDKRTQRLIQLQYDVDPGFRCNIIQNKF